MTGLGTSPSQLALSGVEISEAGALQLAKAAGHAACRNGRAGYAKSHLGERAGAGGVDGYQSGQAVPRPSYISPFLRWGVCCPLTQTAASTCLARLGSVLCSSLPSSHRPSSATVPARTGTGAHVHVHVHVASDSSLGTPQRLTPQRLTPQRLTPH